MGTCTLKSAGSSATAAWAPPEPLVGAFATATVRHAAPSGYTKAEMPQDAFDLAELDVLPENALHFRPAQTNRRTLDPAGNNVDLSAFERSAGAFQNQLCDAIAGQRA